MAWLKDLFTPTRTGFDNEAVFPIHVNLGELGLKAHIFSHDMPTSGEPIPCWSYVTEGLIAYKQKELVLTLQRASNETPAAYPREPLALFVAIGKLAQEGRLVDVGGVTQFGAETFLGYHLTYIWPQPLAGVTIPRSALQVILVTEDEVKAVMEFGVTRLMARLGQASSYYPCPPWSDRKRPGLSFAEMRQCSLLARIQGYHASGASVLIESQQTILRVLRQTHDRLAAALTQLPTNSVFALLTDLDSQADGCLTWEVGQSVATAITPPNSSGARLSGCFVIFVPEQQKTKILLKEDGVVVMLTDRAWSHLRSGLLEHKDITVSTPEGNLFRVQWVTGNV